MYPGSAEAGVQQSHYDRDAMRGVPTRFYLAQKTVVSMVQARSVCRVRRDLLEVCAREFRGTR